MERENPNNSYLRCVDTNHYDTLRSPQTNPKSIYSDLNAERDCLQIPQSNHELKDHVNSIRTNHTNIKFEPNGSDVLMTYPRATSHPPKSFVVDYEDPYLSAVELSSDS